METRRLGRTGFKASVLALGGCALGWLHKSDEVEDPQRKANEAIDTAISQGINIIDVAPTYGEAELRLKPWLEKNRKKVFLACKTMERSKQGTWEKLRASLKRLGTSTLDLYQFHAVSTMEDCNLILGKNGALEAALEARETGVIKHIGITGHSDMRVLQEALNRCGDFSTVLLPVYVAAKTRPNPINNYESILKMAINQDIGVIAIKAIAKRRWTFAKKYGTWYQPMDDSDWIREAVAFTLSQDGVTTYSLPCDLRLWPMVIDAVQTVRKLDRDEQAQFIKRAEQHYVRPLFPI
ncbi:MAG: aldo/keto reductase [Candidatus Heimdallarchaeota archaeon]